MKDSSGRALEIKLRQSGEPDAARTHKPLFRPLASPMHSRPGLEGSEFDSYPTGNAPSFQTGQNVSADTRTEGPFPRAPLHIRRLVSKCWGPSSTLDLQGISSLPLFPASVSWKPEQWQTENAVYTTPCS